MKAVLALNKIDLVLNKEQILSKIVEYTALFEFEAVIPVSAKTGDGVDMLLIELQKHTVESPHFFDADALTDQPEKVIAAEIIREKLLRLLEKEVPHGIAIEIEKFVTRDDSDILDIDAVIYCEKDSHKGIVIGKQGAMLKKAGSFARKELEDFFECKVNLQLWVKVKEDWRNKHGMLRNFGLKD